MTDRRQTQASRDLRTAAADIRRADIYDVDTRRDSIHALTDIQTDHGLDMADAIRAMSDGQYGETADILDGRAEAIETGTDTTHRVWVFLTYPDGHREMVGPLDWEPADYLMVHSIERHGCSVDWTDIASTPTVRNASV